MLSVLKRGGSVFMLSILERGGTSNGGVVLLC